MALDQVTVEYNANIGKLQSDLAGAEAAFRKTDQAATQSAGKISGAFQKTGGIVENLNAHLRSLEQRRDKAMNPAIIQVFNKRIDETRAKIQALTGQVDKSGQSMVLTFKNIAASVGIAFGVQQVLRFGKELINLALKADEVKIAFNQLNNPEILDNVRDAVGGTVDDITLMQSILKAESLTIPLEDLATLFEFAERKAGALGLTTEETFQTIIQAIGARSPRAFTSLGISVFEVQEKLKGMNFETASIADVSKGMGEIFRDELAKMGPAVDSNSDKIARLNAQLTNLKVKTGNLLLGVFTGLGTAITGVVDLAGDAISTVANLGDAFSSAGEYADDMSRAIEGVTFNLIPFSKEMLNAEINISRLSKAEQEAIKATEGIAEAYQKMFPAGIQATEVNRDLVRSIFEIKKEQEALNEELNAPETTSRTRQLEINARLKILSDELTIAMGGETEAMKKHREEVEKNRQEYEKWLEVQREIAKERERQELILDPKESIIPVTNALDEMTQGVNDLLSGLKTLAEEGGLDATLIENRIAITDIISSIDQLEGELSILSSVGDAFGSLYQVLSKDSADFANFQKALALFQIAIDSAQAVSAAVRVAVTSSTNPIQAAVQIAATIALVLANIAKAKQLIEGAQVPAFAEGDINIKGPGTKKSDSIPARLSRGESVITADGTTLDPDLLRAMNKGESEFLKHIQVNYVWPYMEQVIKAHSKAEAKGLNFTDKNLLKELRTGNKLQIKTTQAMIAAMKRNDNNRGKRA